MGLGARLKDAREIKGISLDELQDTTKIQKRYLVAIEEENFSVLPGKFYAKAFIKEYAIAVGLDPNELMEEYKQDIPSPEDEDVTTQYTRIHRSRKDNMPTKSNAIFSFIPTLIVIILILGIVFLAWWFITTKANEEGEDTNSIGQTGDNDEIYRNDDPEDNVGTDVNEEENETEQPEDTESEEEEEQEEPEPELTIEVVELGTAPQYLSELEVSNVGESLKLEFNAENDVWLDVKDDGSQVFFTGFARPNEPIELDVTGTTRIFLNIGSAPNLTVKINDVELEYPVDPNERGADHQQIWLNITDTETNTNE
ncbi:XRE family transcriptional regulator [Ornithinibacillus halotolerans]|uniref:XRE family transcriptional regulator n=2 Tax=Ornithinibacillus halotolerans TaxID=1274357 RepID=A0A916RPX9_9BACI|nr:XRE family transcriptional regulator [Ornithinibacillus halotolerans]